MIIKFQCRSKAKLLRVPLVLAVPVLLGMVSLLSVGCSGSDSSPEQAREKLTKLNLKFPDDFMRAVKNNDMVAVRLFLTAGIDTEEQDEAGHWTALMQAASKGNLELAQLLLDHAANPFAKIHGGEWDGWTPDKVAEHDGFTAVADTIKAAQSKAAEGLGTVPGKYVDLPNEKALDTNQWEFATDGSFRSISKSDGETDREGSYTVRDGKVIFLYCKLYDGSVMRNKAKFNIVSNGLEEIVNKGSEDYRERLVKVVSAVAP